MQKIGFIGLGIMGKSMAANLMKAGYELTVYNRTASKGDELVAKGAKRALTPKEAAEGNDVIITIVSDTPDVERVIFGENGALEGCKKGAVIVEMSTISASATRSMAARLEEAGVEMIDAPVSGGDTGAREGTLTIMCGGKEEVFESIKPVLFGMGKKVTLMGGHGAGQATKMCNQTALASCLLGVCECMMLASKEGLDCEKVVEVLSGGAAQSAQMTAYGKRMVNRDYAAGFFIDLFQKDIRLVMEAVREHNLCFQGLSTVQQMFNAVQGMEGGGQLGSQGLALALEMMCGTKMEK